MGISIWLLLELGKPRVLALLATLCLAGAVLSPNFLHPQFHARITESALALALERALPGLITPVFWSAAHAFGAVVVVALLWLGTALINDVADQAIDTINAPFRPLPSRRISPAQTLRWALGLQVAALLLVLAVGSRQALLLALTGAALGNAYSMPPIRLRRSGLAANLIIGIGVAMAVIGGMLAQGTLSKVGLASSGVLGLLAAAASMVKDFKDVDGDRRSGISTLPAVLGIRSAAIANLAIVSVAYLTALTVLIQRIGFHFVVLVGFGLLAIANLGLLAGFLSPTRPGYALRAYRQALLIFMGVTVLYVGVQEAAHDTGDLWLW